MKKPTCLFAALGFIVWLALMGLLVFHSSLLSISNAPVVLILASSIYSLLLPLYASLLCSALAVLAFNYLMVPPVHTFHVDLHEHGILLLTVMAVSWLITYLLKRQKAIAALERKQSRFALDLMKWSERLREAEDPRALLPDLHAMLAAQLSGQHAALALLLGFDSKGPFFPEKATLNDQQREAFQACLTDNRAMGLATGRYESLEHVYLPMRGKSRACGVCVLFTSVDHSDLPLRNLQAFLDQFGLACERRDNLLLAQQARDSAYTQRIRGLFLSSIAHDQRTPLASILTAASTIAEQFDQLSADELKRNAELIQAETRQMARLTDNTLSLARLSGGEIKVPFEQESVEDIVAAVLQRIRQRSSECVPSVQVQGNLPLLNCNMVLIEQVLDNLIDNAIKHSGAPNSVSVDVFEKSGCLHFHVSDQGVGFREAPYLPMGDKARGFGVGLKLCEAVAAVHGGSMSFSRAQPQGCVAALVLPLSCRA